MANGNVETTQVMQGWIDRLRNGDDAAREKLLEVAGNQLLRMTQKIKKDFQRVGRWEQTEDVYQNASLRLYNDLKNIELNDVRHFFSVAAMYIRRELIDLSRHHLGPQGRGGNHASVAPGSANGDGDDRGYAFDAAEVSMDPQRLQDWTEFHKVIDTLPEAEREVVNLLWYHEKSQDEAADVLQMSVRNVKRLWRSAKLLLHDKLGGDLTGI